MENEWSKHMESTPRLRRTSKPSISLGEKEITREELLMSQSSLQQQQQPKSIMKVKTSEGRKDTISFQNDEDEDEFYTSKKVWESPTAPDSVFSKAYPRKRKNSKAKSNMIGGVEISTSPKTDSHKIRMNGFLIALFNWIITKIRGFLRFLLQWIARKKLAV